MYTYSLHNVYGVELSCSQHANSNGLVIDAIKVLKLRVKLVGILLGDWRPARDVVFKF